MKFPIGKWAGLSGLVLMIVSAVMYTVRGGLGLAFWLPFGLGLAGLLAYAALNRREAAELIRSRKARHGANSVFKTLSVVVAVFFVQAIASNHDFSLDLSKGQVHTLSDEGVKAVKNLASEVQIYAFYGPTDPRAKEFEDLLRRLKKVNPAKFSYEFVDMNKSPLLAQKYAVRSLGTSVVVAASGGSLSISTGKEEDVVNALLKVASSSSKVVYVLSGHGEKFIEDVQATGLSELKKTLESSTYTVRAYNLSQAPKVPEDCAVMVLAGPRSDYLPPELAVLDEYLGRGGRLVVALDPRMHVGALASWLKKAGIEFGNDVVVDFNPLNQMFGGSPIAPIVNRFDPAHAITKDMSEQRTQMIFPLGRSVSLSHSMPSGAQGSALATTFDTAWAYRGSSDRIPAKPTAADTKGPVTVAVAVEAESKIFAKQAAAAKPARIVAMGSSSVLGNQGIAMFNNQDFTVNSVRWLSDEENRISIAPKSEEAVSLHLDKGTVALVWWSLILLCVGTLVLGIVVTVRRRRAL